MIRFMKFFQMGVLLSFYPIAMKKIKNLYIVRTLREDQPQTAIELAFLSF